jgi:hypothetical protein
MSPNLLIKLTWAPEISVSCLGVCISYACMYQQALGGGGGVGAGLVSLRTHKSLIQKTSNIYSCHIALFPSLLRYLCSMLF